MIQLWLHLKKEWSFLYGLGLGLLFITFTIVGYNLTHFPGDLGDARFNNYILEHAHKFFTGEEESLWNAPFMYPEEEVITYSDNLVGSAPFYSIFRLTGFSRETSFQLWFIMMFILSYSCCYLFLKWCFKNRYAAVLGALVFAFSMALQSQMTHAQTFPRFPIPLAFWMCFLFMKELKPFYFFAAIFMIVYQFYCGIYLGFLLTIPITSMLLFIFIYKRNVLLDRLSNIRWLLLMITSVVINVLIMLPLILPYIERSKLVGLNLYDNIIVTVPTIRSFFFSQSGSLFWDFLNKTAYDYPAFWDHQLFAGGIATICLFLFSILITLKLINKNWINKLRIDPLFTILFLSTIVTFLFFTRYQGFSFYQYIFKLPGFASLRSLTRIINIELFFFAFATSYVGAIVLNKYKKLSIPLFFLLSSIVVADNYYMEGSSYRTEKKVSEIRVNRLLEKMRDIPKGSLVTYEPTERTDGSIPYQIDAMLACQTLQLKTINGYSATSPVGYSSYWNQMNRESREEWLNIKNMSTANIYIVH